MSVPEVRKYKSRKPPTAEEVAVMVCESLMHGEVAVFELRRLRWNSQHSSVVLWWRGLRMTGRGMKVDEGSPRRAELILAKVLKYLTTKEKDRAMLLEAAMRSRKDLQVALYRLGAVMYDFKKVHPRKHLVKVEMTMRRHL